MKNTAASPLIALEFFNWTLTAQAGSARVETRRTHPLHKGGIVYAQRYNINKDLFHTASEREPGLFSEPDLEGITCPPSLLDAWIVAARQGRSAGVATSSQSTPQIKRLRKAFEAMKCRIHHALSSSIETSFGVREEYRISWELFMHVNPSTGQPSGSHRPFWELSTASVNNFMRWEFNRWISAINFVRVRGTRRDCGWEDHQRNMIMVTILLRSLKASINCHHIAKQSQLFKDRYQNRQGKNLRGMNFEGSMRDTGLAWLPCEFFNWSNLHLLDELVPLTTFTFDGLQGIFGNWKDADFVNKEYSRARELENCLQNCPPDNHSEILDDMRKMVYRQFALQVIQQLCVSPNLDDGDKMLQQGSNGLSFDIIRTLVGEGPYLAQLKKGNHSLGHTYPKRVQGLFNWVDDIIRTFWDHCFYRQLARRFYESISALITCNEADNWKNSLGKRALPYFWIIPLYDKHSLFARTSRANQPSVSRPFISGIFQWDPTDNYSDLDDETKWLFGGNICLTGHPDRLTEQGEQVTIDPVELDETERYTIDFKCSFPFSEVPRIIREGFKAC